MPQGHRDKCIGGARQRPRRCDHVEGAAKISQSNQKRALLLRKAQRAHDRGIAPGARLGFFTGSKTSGKHSLWIRGKTSSEPWDIGRREAPEKRRMIGECQEKGADIRLSGEILQFGILGPREKLGEARPGAASIGQLRRGTNALPERRRHFRAGRGIAHAASSGFGKANGASGSRRTGTAGSWITTRRPGPLSSSRKLPL